MPETTLADLQPGQSGTIAGFTNEDDPTVQRLAEMGLLEDEPIRVVRLAPIGDPMEVEVRGYFLSVRRAHARLIRITPQV
ncbi:MAG: FeoA family protein [Sumerlaeia bacterium]